MDLKIGKRFGNVVVQEDCKKIKGKMYLLCKCDCGNLKYIRSDCLCENSNCGCQTKKLRSLAKTKHGFYYTERNLLRRLEKIKDRCLNENHKYYRNYGGRGISICPEWLDKKDGYKNFCEWALSNGYKKGLEIDRIDNNGDYCPENCRWVTKKENCRNTRQNINITYRGQTHCLQEWCEILKMSRDCLYYRIKRRGWSIEKAFNTPCRQSNTGVPQ